ncbi:MAG: hypothetical protein IH598_10900 [Bacteroidales bacterium]|nr:hypothetical protein [Bacteroidales bacterium]
MNTMTSALFVLASLNFTFVSMLQSQNPYQVVSFGKDVHAGGNQNWGISLNERGEVFIANNAGLVVMDGSRVMLFKLPSETIIRSVACVGEKVFAGSFEEFGYWQSGEDGRWQYRSLLPLLKDIKLNNDEFWKIISHNNLVYFQSFGNILCFDGNSIESIKLPDAVLFLLKAGDHLFTQVINGSLYELIGKELKRIENSEIFSDTEIKSILPLSDGKLLIGTSSKGLFKYSDGLFSEWYTEASVELKTNQLNNGALLGDLLVFGTLLKGVYIIDQSGKLKHHLHSGNSIQNNTILSLHAGVDGNLWVGMDKGVDYVWFNAPIEVYNDAEEGLGAVYSACLFQNRLFLGTNQGVYYYELQPDGGLSAKRFIADSQGQVWFLKEIDNNLYCGSNNGTFVLAGDFMLEVSAVSGGYNLSEISINDTDYLLQSTYNSLVLFSKQDHLWKQSATIEGFTAPARFLEVDYLGNVLLGHSINGLYLLQPSPGYQSIEQFRKLDSNDGLQVNTNRLFRVDNRILIPGKNKLLQWNAIEGRVSPFEELNEQLAEFCAVKTIVPVFGDKYWFVRESAIGMFEIRFRSAKLLYRIIPEMFGLDLVENYENIVALNDSLHLICLEEGFALLNIYKLNQQEEINKPPTIRLAGFSNELSEQQFIGVGESNKVSNRFNNFFISFSSQEPVGRKKYYQYKLDGIDDGWSDWSGNTEVKYSRLPPGQYLFNVRTLTAKGLVTPSATVSFTINRPWFLSFFAIIIDALLIIGFVSLIIIFYKKRKWKQKELDLKRENEKIRQQKDQALAENIKLSNEKLQAEVSLKNLQLAKNTMAIIRKNEALIEIKDELEKQKDELGYRLPAKYYENMHHLIERNISQDHDWQIFEQLFDQAHENFFQRLKAVYPDLTTSDLRLCAYLRINLSSKEIAPLLNITTRGVEEKRYRLRKRLNLAAEQSLAEFIMGF